MWMRAIPGWEAILALVVALSATATALPVPPPQALAGHPAGVGCPHDHPDGVRTASTCRPGVGPTTTCQVTGTCSQRAQCNCVFASELAAETTASDLLTNFQAVLTASAIPSLGPTIACPKLSALAPLLRGWNETFSSYASSPRCATGLGYVSSDFMLDVDTTLKHLPEVQSLASSCGLSSVLPVLSDSLTALLSAQSCHLAGMASQVQGGGESLDDAYDE